MASITKYNTALTILNANILTLYNTYCITYKFKCN